MSDELETRLSETEARLAVLTGAVAARRAALAETKARLEARALELARAREALERSRAREAERRAQYLAVQTRCYEHLKGGVEVLLRDERKD